MPGVPKMECWEFSFGTTQGDPSCVLFTASGIQAQRNAFLEKSIRSLEAERFDTFNQRRHTHWALESRRPCRSELLVRTTVAEEQLKQLQKHLKDVPFLRVRAFFFFLGGSLACLGFGGLVGLGVWGFDRVLENTAGDDRGLPDADSEPENERKDRLIPS